MVQAIVKVKRRLAVHQGPFLVVLRFSFILCDESHHLRIYLEAFSSPATQATICQQTNREIFNMKEAESGCLGRFAEMTPTWFGLSIPRGRAAFSRYSTRGVAENELDRAAIAIQLQVNSHAECPYLPAGRFCEYLSVREREKD